MWGLWRGTSLALFGVSNGALQFMAYEKMKVWGFQQKRKAFAIAGKPWSPNDDKLVRPPDVTVARRP
jgi:solute carrier family 25 folate transporter 32